MGELIERATETAAVHRLLAQTASGAGGSLLVQGPAGIGRTALARHAETRARTAGFAVLAYSPTPVSPALPHGVVRDWLLKRVRATPPGARPFDGPAAALAVALREPVPRARDWTLAELDHALTWVLESIAERQPLLLVVDDLQWADTGSLQLLDLLSARVADLPAALVMTRHLGEAPTAPAILDRIAGRAVRLEPAPLSVAGVERVRRTLETASATTDLPASELHRLTGGVPFLAHELLRAGTPTRAPRSVVDSVHERLGRLGPQAATLARAVAVLGDEATPESVAALAGPDWPDLAGPLEALVATGILVTGTWQLRPAYPLVAQALLDGMPATERSALHRAAADHLRDRGRSESVVAGHLLHTLPGADPDVLGLLRSAGEEALAAGSPEVAARLLLRATEESSPEDIDPDLVARAASAHLQAGLPEDARHLWSVALDHVHDPVRLARMLIEIAHVRATMGERESATEAYRRAVLALEGADHSPASRHLRAVLVRKGLHQALYEGTCADILRAAETASAQPSAEDSHEDRLLFAIAAADLAIRATDRDRVHALTRRALGSGRLLAEETPDGFGLYVASSLLCWVDAYAETRSILEAAMAESRRRGSVLGFATASYFRGLVRQRTGDLRGALADFHGALELRNRGWNEFAVPAVVGATLAHIGLGQVQDASALEPDLRTAARRGGFVMAQPLVTAGVVRASFGDHEQALADYRAAARLMGEHTDNPSIAAWRELSVWSLLALGRAAEARALADEAVAHARRWGAPRALAFSLRTQARTCEHDEAVARLTEAAALLTTCSCSGELARTQLDLGARLLDEAPAERDAAVVLLREALEQARRNQVTPVMHRAARLLARAGQPATDVAADPVQTLTAGERRVVELAVAGLTNRQIAQKLFVTVKAVEWHLSNAYRKLGISSRHDLSRALYSDDGPASSSAR